MIKPFHDQQHLKSMLMHSRGSGGGDRSSTLDGPGQSAALQHLRSSGIGGGGGGGQMGPDYVSPDNLRDAASKLFSRNQVC